MCVLPHMCTHAQRDILKLIYIWCYLYFVYIYHSWFLFSILYFVYTFNVTTKYSGKYKGRKKSRFAPWIWNCICLEVRLLNLHIYFISATSPWTSTVLIDHDHFGIHAECLMTSFLEFPDNLFYSLKNEHPFDLIFYVFILSNNFR